MKTTGDAERALRRSEDDLMAAVGHYLLIRETESCRRSGDRFALNRLRIVHRAYLAQHAAWRREISAPIPEKRAS